MNTYKAYAYKIAGEYAPKEARKFIAPMILDSRKDRARICLNHAPVIGPITRLREKCNHHMKAPHDRMFNDYNSGEQDASIAATTMMYEAEELGVHSVWLRGFDAKTAAEVFELPENIIPVMMFAMGYPSERSKPNAWHFKRMPLENFVTEL